jgi:hypothetical protein
VLQRFLFINNAEGYVFPKHDCNVEHSGTIGGESLVINILQVTEQHITLLSGRGATHNITKSDSIPERAL